MHSSYRQPRYLFSIPVAALVLLTACGGSSEPEDDPDPPAPVDSFKVDSLGVMSQLWPQVRIHFNGAVDPATVFSGTSLTLALNEAPVLLTSGPNDRTMLLDAPLLPGSNYALSLSSNVKNAEGDSLHQFFGTFSTRAVQPVTVAPITSASVQRLVVDGAGANYLATLDPDAGKLWFSQCTTNCGQSTSWQSVTIDDSVTGAALAMVRGSDGVVRMVFSGPSTRLRYAECSTVCMTPGQWTRITVDTTSKSGIFVSLTRGPSGALHSLAANWTDGKVHYFTCSSACTTAANWSNAPLAGTDLNEQDLSIAAGTGDVLYGVFRGQRVPEGDWVIRFFTCATTCTTPASWVSSPLETWSFGGSGSDLKVDANGELHHSYILGDGPVYYSHCVAFCGTAANWTRVVVNGTNSGIFTSLGLDASGRLSVGFGGPSGRLWLSNCVDGCTSSTKWRQGELMAGTNSGTHPSVAFGPGGQPRIATGVVGGQYIE
jgi:hypothetical protein